MTLPQRFDGYVIGEGNWNAHVAAINNATSKNTDQDNAIGALNDAVGIPYSGSSSLEDRVTTNEGDIADLNTAVGMPYSGGTSLEDRVTANEGSISSNDSDISNLQSAVSSNDSDIGALNTAVGIPYGGASSLEDRVDALESGGPVYVPTFPNDTTLYGDVISSLPRHFCWFGTTLTNTYLTAQATISQKSFTASEMRFCVTVTGDYTAFEIGLFVGSSLSNMSRVAYVSDPSLWNSVGEKQIAISSVSINAGDYVGFALLGDGSTTVGNFSSTASDGETRNLITERIPYAVFNGGTSSMPTTLDMFAESSGAQANTGNRQTWFALA